MEIEFYKDLEEGLTKIVEVCSWLMKCLNIEAGREHHQQQEKEKRVVVIEHNVDTQKEETLKTNYKNVYHRKDGRWEYVKTTNGKKLYLIASTKEELIKRIRLAKNTEKETRAKTTKKYLTVVAWAYKWLDVYKRHELSIGSIDRYERIIKNHIEPYFKDMRLKTLKQETVQRLISSIKQERTREYVYLTIKQMLRQAYINHKIDDNIAELLTKPRRKSKPNRTALDLEQQKALLAKTKEFDKDMQMFIMFSLIIGSRRGETCRFRLDDINQDKNLVYIRGTKTHLSDRRVKISNEMIELLKQNATGKPNEPYFKHEEGYYTHEVKDVLIAAGAKDKTLHDLRHTCSTNLYYLGVTDKQRQQILGHASIIMTNDIYTNLQEDITAEGLTKLYNNLYFEY